MALIDYEKMFFWLADCEAATTEHLGSLKSASKSELRRHRHICASLLRMIEQGGIVERVSKPDWVINRLKSAAGEPK